MKLTKENIAVVEWDTLLSRQVEEEGRLDVAEARNLVELLWKYIPIGGTVVDAGACIGDHTIVYSRLVGPTGQVHAFEPNIPALQCLTHNMKELSNVVIWNFALGAWLDWASPIQKDTNLGATHLTHDSKGDIHVFPLDAVVASCSNWNRLDFMKIDIEGYEPLMLDGAVKTIQKFRPVLLMEVNDQALGFLGYTREDIYSRLHNLHYSFETSLENSYNLLCLP